MVKRLLDIVCSLIALVVLLPAMALISAGILLSSPGPVLYRSRRVGAHGVRFTMYKFRSMRPVKREGDSVITAGEDPRVFPFGRFIRRCKLDELPQLYNILNGDMSIVGPRPEDPAIVEKYYAPEHHVSLMVPPGLTSPGSLYYYTDGEKLLGTENTEREYIERLLSIKLALDTVYVRRMSLWYDLELIGRTVVILARMIAGRTEFPAPSELEEALRIAVPTRTGTEGSAGVASRRTVPECAETARETRDKKLPLQPCGTGVIGFRKEQHLTS